MLLPSLIDISIQDWYDLGSSSSVRTLQPDDAIPDPFKAVRSPLRDLASCNEPDWIRPDPAHTYAIAGWGKDFVASTIVLLSHLLVFGTGSIQRKLDEAFGRFRRWCKQNHKNTSLTEFSLKAFKIQKPLGL